MGPSVCRSFYTLYFAFSIKLKPCDSGGKYATKQSVDTKESNMKKLLTILVIVVAVFAVIYAFSGKSGANNKVLVAYFSATGNTATVADKLATAIGADLFAIEPAQVYTAEDLDWKNEKSRASVEMADRGSRPEIASQVENMEKYDVIFLGFPIWWGREPSIIDTFVDSYDWNGKTIIPFATSGSTPDTAEAEENFRMLTPAKVITGKRFPADVAEEELKTWAKGLL